MPAQEIDLQFVQAGVESLPEYLLSKELFWPVSARGFSLPRLTIGGLLIAMRRLQAYANTPAAQVELIDFEHRLDAIRTTRRVAWANKVTHEFRARFNLWQNYLSDLRHAPDNNTDAYAHEVSWRVLLDLLADELPSSYPESLALPGLDAVLKSYWHSGDFIWEPELESAFPKEPFWYLYGYLKK